MELFVLSRSSSFERQLRTVLEESIKWHLLHSTNEITHLYHGKPYILITHASSFPTRIASLLAALPENTGTKVAVASNTPTLKEMLHLSQYGICAYFNSYMADTHYRQMLHLLEAGQTWFVPSLLAKALELARLNSALSTPKPELDQLTPRERDVALAVARGMSNKRIAATLDISERTVKTHLTRVFAKLEVKDRVSLAIKLNIPPERFANFG